MDDICNTDYAESNEVANEIGLIANVLYAWVKGNDELWSVKGELL